MNCRKQYLKEVEVPIRHIYWDGFEQHKCTRKEKGY